MNEFDQAVLVLVELFVGGLLAQAETLEVTDQLRGNPTPCFACRITSTDRGQQLLRLGSGQVLLRTAGNQFQQQDMQLRGHARVVLAERAAPVDQNL